MSRTGSLSDKSDVIEFEDDTCCEKTKDWYERTHERFKFFSIHDFDSYI